MEHSQRPPKNRARAKDTKESIPGTQARPLRQMLHLKRRLPPLLQRLSLHLLRKHPPQPKLRLRAVAPAWCGSIPKATYITVTELSTTAPPKPANICPKPMQRLREHVPITANRVQSSTP